MKNPTLVGILMQMQMNLEMKLDAQDLQNNDVKPVIAKDSETKYEMTLRILQDNFANSFFSAKQAYDAIRPYRWKSTVSKFKDEETFRGTILAELQLLKKKGFLSFVDGQGTYCLI
jgi:C4-type Zn-finger protein